MKQNDFLEKANQILETYDSKRMHDYIMNLAFACSETNREDFLQQLDSFKMIPNYFQKKKKYWQTQVLNLIDELSYVVEQGFGINRVFDEYEYDYGWDDDFDNETYDYLDDHELLPVVSDAIDAIHQCVDLEIFQEGYELSKILLGLNIDIITDYGEDFKELENANFYHLTEDILKGVDHRQLLNDFVTLASRNESLENLPECIDSIQSKFGYYTFELQSWLSQNREWEHKDAFLRYWISYLGSLKQSGFQKMIQEAWDQIQDESLKLKTIERYGYNHPSLYEKFLEDRSISMSRQERLKIGCKGLDSIPKYVCGRSKIAVLCANFAKQNQDDRIKEKCLIEAYRSDMSVTNYLRALLNTKDRTTMKNQLRFIFERYLQDKPQYRSLVDEEWKITSPNKNVLSMIHLFNHRFDHDGLDSFLTNQEITPLLLLLLKSRELPQDCLELCYSLIRHLPFSKSEYETGNPSSDLGLEDVAFFYSLFVEWKDSIKGLEAVKKEIYEHLESKIYSTVRLTLSRQERNFYDTMAAYVAALGEVKESWGKMGVKQKILQAYRSEFYRYPRFMKCLRHHGMID